MEGKKVIFGWEGLQSPEDLHSIKTFLNIPPLMSFPSLSSDGGLGILQERKAVLKFMPYSLSNEPPAALVSQSEKTSALNVLWI